MKDLHTVIDSVKDEFKTRGIGKYSCYVSENSKREFNCETGEFALYRTTFDKTLSVKVFNEGKYGSAHGNDLSDEGITSVINDAVAAADSAQPDEARDFAEKQENADFTDGEIEPDEKKLFARIREFNEAVAASRPQIKLMAVYGSHELEDSIYFNTNGTEFTVRKGYYALVCEFVANDSDKTTGLNYFQFFADNLDKPFIEYDAVRTSLDNAVAQLNLVTFTGKFEGTVIFDPVVMNDVARMIVYNFVSDGTILDGTSLWSGKLGERVADEKFTLAIDPGADGIVTGSFYTNDGYRTEPLTVIENGVLKNFCISLYVANKTGLKVSHSDDTVFVVKPGDKAVADMIAGVKHGLLVGGFSGGQPGANGEFSGVAKNSFMIEDGRITGAVSEVMISGNIVDVLNNITAISKETICDGNCIFPYMEAEGVTISGK